MKLTPSKVGVSVCAAGLLSFGLHTAMSSLPTAAELDPVARAAEPKSPPPQQAGTASKQPGKPVRKVPPPQYRSVAIQDVPHVMQKPDFCGEACAAMYLTKLGHRINQDDVFIQAGIDPVLGRGCYTRDLQTALTRIGLNLGPVWHRVTADDADVELESHFRAMHADLVAGLPSIVCTHYDDKPETTEHFRLILGYDAKTDEVLYHEPAVARGAYRRMAREQMLKLWPLKYEEDRWTVVRFRLAPGVIRDVHSTVKFDNADYAQHVMRVKSKTPEGFTIVLQKPFVVIGDESPADVRGWAAGTVKWAADRLKREYFAQDPNDILDVWLFKDKESYDRHTEEIFGDRPHTPFGYFSHKHRALIMNIETGGGTLVHEIVHPFIASNFPECPAWFNEGLASLYEQCRDNRGRIWGLTNWRLEGLQKAIKAEDAEPEGEGEKEGEGQEPAEIPELTSFKTLCNTTTFQFYEMDPGTNYSQARYLCYYLQRRGLLNKYYHQFRRNVRNDPSGYETLKAVLEIKDDAHMEKFQEVWEDWILKLRFP
ncbi:MAG: C39 family peptidase [Planctomycetes bacterium]|nr:C39 family peptidase [Planctomycetota bacterium]MBL7043012.1 C39 family peptidase [Pirellulaceae bacterium]